TFLTEDFLQPNESPAKALAGRRRLDVKDAADLLERQIVGVAQQQDFTVGQGQLGDGPADTFSHFPGVGPLAGRRAPGQPRARSRGSKCEWTKARSSGRQRCISSSRARGSPRPIASRSAQVAAESPRISGM